MLGTQAALVPPSRRRQQGHFFMAVTLNPGHKLYQRSWERLFCVSGAHVRSRPLWLGQLALETLGTLCFAHSIWSFLMPSTFRPLHLVVSDAKLYRIPGCTISMRAIANSTTVAHENAMRSTF